MENQIIIDRFKGLNERAYRTDPKKPSFQVLKNVKPELNGNLKHVLHHNFVHASNSEFKDFYVEHDGDVVELPWTAGKVYTNKADIIELAKREVAVNQQNDDVDDPAFLLLDGVKAPGNIAASTFPGYGIPYNDNVRMVPLRNGTFLTIELNLEIKDRVAGYEAESNANRKQYFNLYDSLIVASVRKFEGTDFKSAVNEKINAKSEDLMRVHPLKSENRHRRKVNFPIWWKSNGLNDSLASCGQYLGWDWCVDDAEDNLYIVCQSSSAIYYDNIISLLATEDHSMVQEYIKIIHVDISSDTIRIENVYTTVKIQKNTDSKSTMLSKLYQGFTCAVDSNVLYIKGMRWWFKYDLTTKVQTTGDIDFEMPGESKFIKDSRDGDIHLYIEEDGIYDFIKSTFDKSTISLDIAGSALDHSDGDKLLTRRVDNGGDVHLYVANENKVYPIDPETTGAGAIGTGVSAANKFPLYESGGTWTFYNDKYLEPDSTNYLINQTRIKNFNHNAFNYFNDHTFGKLNGGDTTAEDYLSFEDVFTHRRADGRRHYHFEYRKAVWMAIGVRFSETLKTPPINYGIFLPNDIAPFTDIEFNYYNDEILGEASSNDSFDVVNEIYLFGEGLDDSVRQIIDYYYSNQDDWLNGDSFAISFQGLSTKNYTSIMSGIDHTDSFSLFYKSFTRVGGLTLAIGPKEEGGSINTLTQVVYKTNGHPASLNGRSDGYTLNEIRRPVKIIGLNEAALIIGETDIGFVYDSGELNVYQYQGSKNFNAVASDGEICLYITRQGVMAVSRDRVRLITEDLIDESVFSSLSDSDFLEVSGAILGSGSSNNMYILAIGTKLYCFDLDSTKRALHQGTEPIIFTSEWDVTADFDTVGKLLKLRSHNGNVYGLQVITHAAVTDYNVVQLFVDSSGSATQLMAGAGGRIVQTYSYDNRNAIHIRTNEFQLAPFRHNLMKWILFMYTNSLTSVANLYVNDNNSEKQQLNETIPASSSFSDKQRLRAPAMKGDHASWELTTYGDLELERVDFGQ